jgi:hypothetical protein
VEGVLSGRNRNCCCLLPHTYANGQMPVAVSNRDAGGDLNEAGGHVEMLAALHASAVRACVCGVVVVCV